MSRDAREPQRISVVIAWVNPFELLRPCLDALRRQRIPPDEVIVVTRHGHDLQMCARRLYPEVLVIAAPPATPIPTLHAIGIRRTRGDAVAITEDHCIPDDEWTVSLAQSLRADCSVVGGPVDNACRARLRDWAAFLTEYAPLLPSAHEQPAVRLGANNVAYRRQLLDGLCEVLERGMWASFYNDALAARGVEFAFNPRMLVHHQRPFDFGYFLQQRYHFSRSFAAMRCETFSLTTRARYAIGTCILPPLLIVRGVSSLAHKRRYLGVYVCCLPLVAIYVSVGAVGELVGYVVGGGDSLARVE
jgi:hypothetical protein